jgi:hypothetical protein
MPKNNVGCPGYIILVISFKLIITLLSVYSYCRTVPLYFLGLCL